MSYYDFDDIDRAMCDAEDGTVIKPVLRFWAGGRRRRTRRRGRGRHAPLALSCQRSFAVFARGLPIGGSEDMAEVRGADESPA